MNPSGYNPYAKNTGYSTYRETSIKTASQGKLVVMLYEEAVKQLESTVLMITDDGNIEPKNIESFGQKIQKVEDIITELEVTLDMEKGGEIAKNLMALYVYFNKELMNANINHDKKKILFVLDMLTQLRDSWIQAANSVANTNTALPQDRPSLNITG